MSFKIISLILFSLVFSRSTLLTLLTMTQDQELEQIKSRIQDHLILSGNYETINKQLKLQLYESGWYDDIQQMATQELQDQAEDDKTMSFEELLAFIRPKAESMVSEDVKKEVMGKIKGYLEDVIQ